MNVELDKLIGKSFYGLHHEIKQELYDDYWLRGGRGSLKSTFISIEILLGMLRDPEANAVACRRYQNELRNTVYGQFEWSAGRLGIDHLFKFQVSPMQIIHRKTGQKIILEGADNPRKIKSVNLGRGYIKYVWFEELDQYAGMEEIRNILQSLFRGEDRHRIAFYSYNPPKSGRSWVNQESKISAPGKRVHSSDFRAVPPEWLGQRFLALAEALKVNNEMAYRHEYLGEEVGTGLEVFTNVEIRTIPADERAIFDQIRQGLDFGFAVDPLCFEQMHFDRTRRTLYFLEEISGIGLHNREFFEKAKPYISRMTIADSAEPKSISELKGMGMVIKPAKKGPDSVDFGVSFLQGLDKIVIDGGSCPRAAKEFINYALEMDRNGEVKSRFPDKDQHAIDSARYGIEDDMLSDKAAASSSTPAAASRKRVEEMFN